MHTHTAFALSLWPEYISKADPCGMQISEYATINGKPAAIVPGNSLKDKRMSGPYEDIKFIDKGKSDKVGQMLLDTYIEISQEE